jgi:hypothetical protein
MSLPCCRLRAAIRRNLSVRPVKNYRATYEQEVIDAWAARVAQRNRGIGKAQVVLLCGIAAVFVWLLLAPNLVNVLLLFAAVFYMVVLQLVDRASLLCPHCNQPPISSWQRGAAESADFCVHCCYWLKSPYSRDGAQV